MSVLGKRYATALLESVGSADADRAAKEALALCRAAGDPYGVGNALNMLMFNEADIGTNLRLLNQAQAAFEAAGYLERQGMITTNLGIAYINLGLYRRGRRTLRKARDIYRRAGSAAGADGSEQRGSRRSLLLMLIVVSAAYLLAIPVDLLLGNLLAQTGSPVRTIVLTAPIGRPQPSYIPPPPRQQQEPAGPDGTEIRHEPMEKRGGQDERCPRDQREQRPGKAGKEQDSDQAIGRDQDGFHATTPTVRTDLSRERRGPPGPPSWPRSGRRWIPRYAANRPPGQVALRLAQ